MIIFRIIGTAVTVCLAGLLLLEIIDEATNFSIEWLSVIADVAVVLFDKIANIILVVGVIAIAGVLIWAMWL